MSHKFEDCIKGRGLRKCPIDALKIEREITEARKDLESAKASHDQSDYKWAIIKAYYSMFHACRSVLFSVGYNEKSHDCLITAIEDLFTDTGKLPSSLITDIRGAKTAREAADYGLTYGIDAAIGIVQDAENMYHIITEYHKTRGT